MTGDGAISPGFFVRFRLRARNVTAQVVQGVASRALSGNAWQRATQRRAALAPRPLAHYPRRMCRSIKTLRRAEIAATTGELEAAARQYVRKISGYRTPSARNSAVFDAAIADVTASSRRLMEALGVVVQDGADPMDRPRARLA